MITDLWKRGVRYYSFSGLKDIGRLSLEPCGCHQKTPILKVVEGRVADSIVLRDGRVLHPFSLTLTLEHIEGIARFQIVQESFDKINVFIVPDKEGFEEQAHSIENNLKSVIGDGVSINTLFVKDIPHMSNGHSHHVVISKIAQKCLK